MRAHPKQFGGKSSSHTFPSQSSLHSVSKGCAHWTLFNPNSIVSLKSFGRLLFCDNFSLSESSDTGNWKCQRQQASEMFVRLRQDHSNLNIWLRSQFGLERPCVTEPINQILFRMNKSFSYDARRTKKSKVKLLTTLQNLSTDTPSVYHSTPAKKTLKNKKKSGKVERSPGCLGRSTGLWWPRRREGRKRSQSRSLWTEPNHPFPENCFVNFSCFALV